MNENQTVTPPDNKGNLKQFLPSIIIFGVCIIAAVAFFMYQETRKEAAPLDSETESTLEEGGASVVDTTPGYTIEEIPLSNIRDTMPDLTRQIAFSAGIPAEVRTMISAKRDTLAVKLDTDPTQIADWLEFALQYHAANDYEGARIIWGWLITVAPKETTAYENLGRLYHFSTPDFPKAESYFKQSLAINPDSTTAYNELYELYTLSYKKETSAAVDILKLGANRFPENPDFPVRLGLLYHTRGDVVNARLWLEKGMSLARALNNVGLISRIGEELAKLPQ